MCFTVSLLLSIAMYHYFSTTTRKNVENRTRNITLQFKNVVRMGIGCPMPLHYISHMSTH